MLELVHWNTAAIRDQFLQTRTADTGLTAVNAGVTAVNADLTAVNADLTAVDASPTSVNAGLTAVDASPTAVNAGPTAVNAGPIAVNAGLTAVNAGVIAVDASTIAVNACLTAADGGARSSYWAEQQQLWPRLIRDRTAGIGSWCAGEERAGGEGQGSIAAAVVVVGGTRPTWDRHHVGTWATRRNPAPHLVGLGTWMHW